MVSVKGQISRGENKRENERDINHERERSQFKINPEVLNIQRMGNTGGWGGGTNTGKILNK